MTKLLKTIFMICFAGAGLGFLWMLTMILAIFAMLH
jgi:hypothetical protein